MKKCLLILIILPLFSAFTSCIEERTRNISLATVGTVLVIGGIVYYFCNSNPTATSPDKSTLNLSQTDETDNSQDNVLQQPSTIISFNENNNELPSSRQETIQILEEKINQQQEETQRPYANPQVTFLKTLKTSLKELEAYQKNHGH